jgi:hypothetical protein
MEIELELGGFYTCIHDEFDPVVIWIGRVDLPDDLGAEAHEPVVSLVVKSPDPDTPINSFAPFWESLALGGELQDADPFVVNQELFDENYNNWRTAYEQGEAYPWTMTPNEVYAQMITDLMGALQK